MELFQNFSLIIVIVLILTEGVVRFKNGIEKFEIKDSLVCILLGVTTIFLSLAMKGVLMNYFSEGGLEAIYQEDFPVSSFVLLLVLIDFSSYWYHRLAHYSRLFWASHIVHHSSKMFNLTIGIRESIVEGIYRFIYWSFFCLIGFPPVAVFFADGISLVFQFLIHTQYVKKLGWIENIFNTPSNHRVHHSSNPEYIDKNFGAILIIWDKIFGTFVSEKRKPEFGVVGEESSLNPIDITMSEWRRIYLLLRKAKSFKEILQSLFGHPGLDSLMDNENSKPIQ